MDNFSKLFQDVNPYHHTFAQVKAYADSKGLTLAESLRKLNALIRNALEKVEKV